MNYAAETNYDETVESGYWMREIEFPESTDIWALEDFEDLISSNNSL